MGSGFKPVLPPRILVQLGDTGLLSVTSPSEGHSTSSTVQNSASRITRPNSPRSSTANTPSGSTGGDGRAINGDGDVLLNIGFTGSAGLFVLSSPPVPE
jgi:hypothetical protein